MDETTYPFVDWTDFPRKDGSGRSRVVEDICIGRDFWHNRGELTQVQVFSSCFRPTQLNIAGQKAVGLFAENRGGEYVFCAVFEDVAVGEMVRIAVWLEGRYTERARTAFEHSCYRSNFAWLSPHVQRIVFPKGYEIASVMPQDGLVGQWRGQPAVVWRRPEKFWGEVQVWFRQ